ncbi:helix-turn-helix domain-containing protein [Sphingobacterium chuzhouense]|uniref:Helix-turn-helix transcriptional regulator n=1 Tax=Sphingobacterium chuzhouense TaxID=1742264 RepID=A0ABR7XTW4_9SPHI|nr:helix-turn-helix transcriptional regulator [Sphingobacterium chuzhouense]MBD1421772.1 helix-turn-helix transcriptional regulator [Sphingobacterium chuzhouense]
MSEKKLDTLDRRACAYILEHYMEPDLDRHRIAAALGCSTRNLSRAFEGSGVKLHAYIRLLRLHKGRELLHKRPHLSIEQIADRLHFSSARHFATRYKKAFGLSPAEERKLIRRRK